MLKNTSFHLNITVNCKGGYSMLSPLYERVDESQSCWIANHLLTFLYWSNLLCANKKIDILFILLPLY